MGEKNAETSVMVENFWCHTRYLERRRTFISKISDFRLCKDRIAHAGNFDAPSMLEWDWELNVYPEGISQEYRDFISVFMETSVHEYIDTPISVELCLVDAGGEKFNCKFFSDLSGSKVHLGVNKFMALEDLMKDKDHLLPNDELTISCTIITMEKVDEEIKSGELKWPQLPSRFPDLKGQALSDDFLKLYQDMQFCDVTLKCGETEIKAHKIILAFRSSAFAAMLKLNMLDAEKITLDISDVESDVLQELVHYIYSDSCSFYCSFYDVNYVLKLLDAAGRFGIPSLESRCEEYLNDKMSVDNVFDVIAFANDKDHEKLRQSSIRFICDQMSSLAPGWESKLHSMPRILGKILQCVDQKNTST